MALEMFFPGYWDPGLPAPWGGHRNQLRCRRRTFPRQRRNRSATRYRERKCSSGDKTDCHDAWSQADALRLDAHSWRALTVQDPVVAELRILCRDEVALIEERTALANQLQQALHEYDPTALEAFDDCSQWGRGPLWKHSHPRKR